MHKINLLLILLLITGMPGCGGKSSGPGIPLTVGVASTPVSLTVTDTPPLGVQVLFFQLSITSAVLQPGNISLLNTTTAVPVNVSELQTETAFLGTANVATGTYSSLALTFANPELTIFNGTGAAIGTCAANTVCELAPTATPLTLTFSAAPFPVTVAANTPLTFELEIYLNTIIQPDLSVNLAATNGVSIAQLPAVAAASPVVVLGNLLGTVQSLGNNQFTLETGDGRTFNILANSSTTYSNFPSCAADNFSCVATGEIINVGLSLQAGGTLLASTVTYDEPAGQQVVEGNVIGLTTSGGNTVMQIIFQKGPPTATVLPFGNRAAVTVPASGVTFAVDSGGFTIPAGLSFASAGDLTVGQEVQVEVSGSLSTSNPSGNVTTGPLGPAPSISFTTNSVTLEPSQATGTVATVNQSTASFSIQTFPNFFLPPGPVAVAPVFGATSIDVLTTTQTTFQNISPESMQGIAQNGVVSVEGWLFSTPVGVYPTTIAANTVVGRPGPIPLF